MLLKQVFTGAVLLALLCAGCATPNPNVPAADPPALAPSAVPPDTPGRALLLTPTSAPAKTSPTPPPTLLLPTPIPTLPATIQPTLRELAAARQMRIGVAVDPKFLEDPEYAALVAREFNAVVPENVMKWERVHPAPGQYDFSGGDEVVAFAQQHGMTVFGHVLVWDNQLPEWVREGEFSGEQWREILREHITTVVGHYRGQVEAWHVVNEAFDDDGLLRDTIWLREIGPEYIGLAFRWAHEADPDAKLIFNEHAGEGLNVKSEAVYSLMQGLLEAGVPVHGVGLQMHVWLDGPPTAEELAANMERLNRLGLEVHITEMDVRTQYSEATAQEKLAAQAETYRQAVTACREASNCPVFMTWGLTDRHSWIPGYTGQPDAPLLFDEQWQPKPAYYAVLEALQ